MLFSPPRESYSIATLPKLTATHLHSPSEMRTFDHPATAVSEYYRCPESLIPLTCSDRLSEDCGFFRWGRDAICYGRSSTGLRGSESNVELYDVEGDTRFDGTNIILPFNPAEICSNLRYERYLSDSQAGRKAKIAASALRKAYYLARPLLPVPLRKHLQKIRLSGWQEIVFPRWPVDITVETIFQKLLALVLKTSLLDYLPFIWFWPNGYPSAAILTHDVETTRGRNFCSELMDLDDSFGIKSSFQLVPEKRYRVTAEFVDEIWKRGFEVNVHDLNHDGRLTTDGRRFGHRAERINHYGREFRAAGFRSAALYRNLEWWQQLDFAYDMSVPCTGHIEAQQGGCCSIMPFFAGELLELPVTTTQDYALLHFLNERSIDLWIRQIDLISSQHGLISFIIHPDYVIAREARNIYAQLLTYLRHMQAERLVWMALPHQVNHWWRQRMKMRLIYDRNWERWTIEGEGRGQARIAYATLDGDHVRYSFEPPCSSHNPSEDFRSTMASQPVPAA